MIKSNCNMIIDFLDCNYSKKVELNIIIIKRSLPTSGVK